MKMHRYSSCIVHSRRAIIINTKILYCWYKIQYCLNIAKWQKRSLSCRDVITWAATLRKEKCICRFETHWIDGANLAVNFELPASQPFDFEFCRSFWFMPRRSWVHKCRASISSLQWIHKSEWLNKKEPREGITKHFPFLSIVDLITWQ